MVTFSALRANVTTAHQGFRHEFPKHGINFDDFNTFTWLPQYHDMGLIGALIVPFAAGWRCNAISPITFIKNPVLWIELMSKLKVNWSLGPDFGFHLAARKFLEEKRRTGKEPIKNLDLSSIFLLGSGAEPIRLDSINLFREAFLNYRLRKDWFCGLYGMAEMVVFAVQLPEFKLSNFQPSPGVSLIAVANRDRYIDDVQDIRIVSPTTFTELEDGKVGEIWISGPSVAGGYSGKPELSKEVFQAKMIGSQKNFLRTGDLGFFEDNYLYICGRQKDLIIVGGVNYFPQDIEDVVNNASSAVRPGCVAAFSSNESGGNESLEIVFEIREKRKKEVVETVEMIRKNIIEEIGLIPSRIVAVKERTIHKTTSGKIQRKKNRIALHENTLKVVHELEKEWKQNISETYVPPRTIEEKEMCDLWESTLDVERVGITDNFFEIGGHSMIATQLAEKASCDIYTLMANPTVDLLLKAKRRIEELGGMIDADDLKDINATTRTESRMTYIQKRNPSSNAYNMPFRVQYAQSIDVHANLLRVLRDVPILRTRFVNGRAISDVDVNAIVLEEMSQDLLAAPFDVEEGPLCRFAIERDTNVLVGSFHHSIADGRSVELFFRWIVSGNVPGIAIEYNVRRYAALEAKETDKDNEMFAAALTKWGGIMKDTPERFDCDVISSRSVSDIDASAYNVQKLLINVDMVGKLKKFCKQRKVSMFSFALHALRCTLRGYGGNGFAIGVTYDLRKKQFLETIGMFANTTLFPVYKGDEEKVEDVHRRWVHEILPVAHVPYDELTRLGYGCNVMLVFNADFDVEDFIEGGDENKILYDESFSLNMSESKFDLGVQFIPSAEENNKGIEIWFESGVGEWPLIEERYQLVMEKLLEGESSPQALLESEMKQVMKWSLGDEIPVRNQCLHELFEEQASNYPNAIAMYDKEGTLSMTYAELDARSDMLAVELQSLGVKPETLVGLLLEKSFSIIVCIMGILKAGGAYVPIDPSSPEDRVKYVVDDAGLDILITKSEYMRKDVRKVLCVDSKGRPIESETFVNGSSEVPLDALGRSKLKAKVKRAVKPSNLAYMIYTSGSTGKPKGVLCEHLGAVNIIAHPMERYIEIGVVGVDVVGMSLNMIFDASISTVFCTLGAGLALSMDTKKCTMLHCTPSMAPIYLNDESNKIQSLSVGGEACTVGLENSCDHFRNSYGPTECSIIATAGSSSTSIGKPHPNVQCYIVHQEDGQLCPPGVSGELWIGGIGISRGYHNRAELTDEMFVPNPFDLKLQSDVTGKVYKTGDRVKWSDGGELIYLGRFDHQVKIRGYRIELGEVESALELQADVTGAIAMAYKQKLIAFVQHDKQSSDNVDERSLKSVLKDNTTLPHYMIPWKIVTMDEFPLTSNGKVDRDILMGDFITALDESYVYVAPETPEEKEMCALWETTLGLEKVGVTDDFFEIGGHSLDAMQLAQKLSCSVQVLMANPTVESLLVEMNRLDSMDSGIDIEALEDTDVLTRAESRLSFIQVNNPSSNAYNMPFRMQYAQSIDVHANLLRVLRDVPILRTRFVNGRAISDVDVNAIVLEEMSQDLLAAPFDVEEGPLCRFAIERDTNVLVGSFHHSIADGRSVELFFRWIVSGNVPGIAIEYNVRRYAALEAKETDKDNEMFAAALTKWGGIMKDTPERFDCDVISSRSVSDIDASAYNVQKLLINVDMVGKLKKFCKQRKVSMFSFALHALRCTLRGYGGNGFAIGVTYDLRKKQFLETIGMFANTTLFPVYKGDEEKVEDVHRRWVHEILPVAHVPYDELTRLGYGCNVMLVFNADFDVEDFIEGGDENKILYDESFSLNMSESKFDLGVQFIPSAEENNKGIEIWFESGVGEWPLIEERYQLVMEKLLEGESSPQALLESEMKQVMKWSLGDEIPVRNQCLHELFEEQASNYPNAIAMYDKEGTLSMTYAELDARSDMLAVELQSLGVKPETLVGLLLEKSFSIIVCIMGILKAGGAYVPIDPSSPEDRVKYVVDDAGLDILITKSEYMRKDVRKVLCVDSKGRPIESETFVNGSSEVPLDALGRSKLKAKVKRAVKPSNLAYMIYTSGSTGKPKGVLCEHLGAVNIIAHPMERYIEIGVVGVDVVGMSLNMIFDASISTVFCTLGAGLALSMDTKKCTMLHCTPSMAPIYLNDESNKIQSLSVGGEACTVGLENSCDHFRNSYGPTECSIIATAGSSSTSIGKPHPNVQCYIVHQEDGQLCPPGVSGELWIGGIGISRGYHNRAELTDEMFVPNPFDLKLQSDVTGKVYKTGDRVKWSDGGELIYLGRFDHQVKIRGYRIELGEVESALELQADVTGAIAIAHKNKLIAYVTTASELGRKFDSIGLKSALQEKSSLPHYMIPWRIVSMETFPLTRNGKVDRSQLPIPVISSSVSDPVTPTEIYLVGLFKELLEVEVVGRESNFVDLGGHSLHAMNGIQRIRSFFKIPSFSARDFLVHDTLEQLASFIDKEQKRHFSGESSSKDDISFEDDFVVWENEMFKPKKVWVQVYEAFIKAIGVSVLSCVCSASLVPGFIVLESLFSRGRAVDAAAYTQYLLSIYFSLITTGKRIKITFCVCFLMI